MEIILPILIIIILVMFGGVKTAPDKFSEGKILGADKKRINNELECFLRGASLDENYNCLIKDLKSMSQEAKDDLIKKLESDDNADFTEKELGVIHCILPKMVFDLTTDMVEYSIANAMAKKVQTLSNFSSYYQQYELLKINMLDFGKGFMNKKLQLMFNIKNNDDLSKFIEGGEASFEKYLNALREHLSGETKSLKKLMTEVQDISKINDIDKEKNKKLSGEKL